LQRHGGFNVDVIFEDATFYATFPADPASSSDRHHRTRADRTVSRTCIRTPPRVR